MDAFADLAGLGLTAGKIASKTKSRRRDVVDGLKAARVPEVRDAVQSAGLTLEQGAALEEFSDDPDAYEQLLDLAINPRSWGAGFDHSVQRMRDRRAEEAARDALLAELAQAGTPVIERPDFDSATKRLVDLTDDAEDPPAPAEAPESDEPEFEDGDEDDWDSAPEFGTIADSGRGAAAAPITAEAHAGCPGHAVFITTGYGGPQRGPRVMAVYVCTDPLGQGHRSRTGVPLRQPSGPAPRRADETPEQAEDREAAEKAAKAAARRRVIAGNKAWDSAATVRRGFLAELLTRKTTPKGASTWVAQAFLVDRYTVCRAAERGHRTAAELLCTTAAATGQADHQRVLAALDGASENRATVITLGLVLGAIEGETGRHQWRWNEHRGGRPDAGLVRYLEALAGWGYSLSPVERLAIGEDVDDAEVFNAPGAVTSTDNAGSDGGDLDGDDGGDAAGGGGEE